MVIFGIYDVLLPKHIPYSLQPQETGAGHALFAGWDDLNKPSLLTYLAIYSTACLAIVCNELLSQSMVIIKGVSKTSLYCKHIPPYAM